MIIYLYTLYNEAYSLNNVALGGLLRTDEIKLYLVKDFENDELLLNTSRLYIFKKRINFINDVIYKVKVKIIFLINNMLSNKDMINEFFNMIITLLKNEDIKVTFLT